MDPISHVLVGWCLVEARSQRAAPPILALALGALSPDIDAVLMPTGWDRYLAAHEIGTHSLMGATACGVAAAAVARVIQRRGDVRRLVVPAVIGAVSHVVADLLSGASIRLAWPLLETRVSNLGVAAMGEPLVVIAFAAAAAAMLRWRARRRQIAAAVLGVFGLFILEQTFLRERAELAYREHPARAEATGDYLVEPVWGAPMTWRIYDRTVTAARAWTLDASGRGTVDFVVPLTTGDHTAVAVSTTWNTVRNFRRAHDYAFAVATPEAVMWSDVRYCSQRLDVVPLGCGVWAGGEFSTAPQLRHLVVRIGDVVQRR